MADFLTVDKFAAFFIDLHVNTTNKSIVFFDGECGLCNRSIRFLMKCDRHKYLYFAPIQGSVAQGILPLKYRESLRTMIYQRVSVEGVATLFVRSDAVLLALVDTRSAWRYLAQVARLLPRSFRDWCYDRVANNRKKFFKSASCRLPSQEEQARLLP